MIIRQYNEMDLAAMIRIWNEIVEEGIAFPQEEPLTPETGKQFFAAQTYCAVAEEKAKFSACTFCTRTTWAVAVTFLMQAMRFLQNPEASISAKCS